MSAADSVLRHRSPAGAAFRKIVLWSSANISTVATDASLTGLAGGGITLATGGVAQSWTHTATANAQDYTIALAGAFDASLVLSSTGTGADAFQITASAGGIVMASQDTTASWTHTANGAGDDLTLSLAGAQDASLHLLSAGTGGDSISVVAAAGGIDITAAGDLDIVGTTTADFGDGTGALSYDGAGALALTGTTTVDIDGSGAVSLESSAGAINVGGDAIAQALNLGSAGARVITLGSAAAASLSVDSGIGAWTLQGDTTGALTSGTTMTLTSVAGNMVLDSQGATAAIYNTLGTDTLATEWAVRDNSEDRKLIVTGAGVITLAGAGVVHSDGSPIRYEASGTGTGDVVQRWGGTATEGLQRRIYEVSVVPAAVETNLINLPAFALLESVQANVDAALTGGGTTVTFSIGTAADPDKYGTAGTGTAGGAADALTQNAKLNFAPAAGKLLLGAAEQMVLTGTATGGAADGDTALTVGTVRVRVIYFVTTSLDNA